MEIGSFIALDFNDSSEYYTGNDNVLRLNSARAGIYYSCKLYACKSVYIPFYLCPTVKGFLTDHGIKVKYYTINEKFEPKDLHQDADHAILIVNYFGMLSNAKIQSLAGQFNNVIVDNSAAFYSTPVRGSYTIYSPRKFFGVPDGCYVIGDNAKRLASEYEQDVSSSTSSFLFKRIEFSLKDTYGERMKNEERIDNAGVLRMSKLTEFLLSNINYSIIKDKRRANFQIAHELFGAMNQIDPTRFLDDDCVPMVYPFVFDKSDLDAVLKQKHIFVGRWWKSVLLDLSEETFEVWLSLHMSPLPIDQRYSSQELNHIKNIIVTHTDA